VVFAPLALIVAILGIVVDRPRGWAIAATVVSVLTVTLMVGTPLLMVLLSC